MNSKKSYLAYILVGLILFLNFGLTDDILIPLIFITIIFALIFTIHTYEKHSFVKRILNLF